MFVNFYRIGTPRFPKSPPDQMIGYLRKETRLQCNAIGHPTPEVIWTRSPLTPLPQGRTEVKKDGLFITNTETGDEGLYICTVTNKYGMILHGTFLKVKSVGK